MAEAFAKIHGKGRAVGMSAGSKPSGKINEKAIASMKELGYDLSRHASKSVEDFRDAEFDYVVTMGCGDACPFIPAQHRLDWQIPDPGDMNPDEFRKVRYLIEEKVKQLLDQL